MSTIGSLTIYFSLWTVVFFMMLPLGNRLPKISQKGWASGAPENPRMGRKLLLTTVFAFILWSLAHYVAQQPWFTQPWQRYILQDV